MVLAKYSMEQVPKNYETEETLENVLLKWG